MKSSVAADSVACPAAWPVGVGRGTESPMDWWLHRMPVGVVVSASFTPLGAPAVMQKAVIVIERQTRYASLR